jgi:hypothetical protein
MHDEANRRGVSVEGEVRLRGQGKASEARSSESSLLAKAKDGLV